MISIVIPHLNQPEFLQRCLGTLAVQIRRLPDTEVIVVDNGSSQSPAEICAMFGFATLMHEAEAGPGPARNAGVARSTGDIIAFIDADCIADGDWLDVLNQHFLAQRDAAIAGGDVKILLGEAGRATGLEAYESVFGYRQADYIEKMGFSATLNMAVRRRVFETVGRVAGIAVAEDREWGQRATAMGFRIRYLPEMIVHHPARSSFAQLCRKWDRHVSHDFSGRAPGIAGLAGWMALALAVGASGLVDIRKVIASRRIATPRERSMAAVMLLRIRLYRMWRMLTLLRPGRAADSGRWNRQ